MADNLLYEISSTTEMTGEPFIKKEVVYVIDQNNGSYSNNQIIMDLASVSNSGKWASWREARLQIPLLVTLGSTFNFSAINSDFAVGLKNGFHHLISSLNVDYNNSSVVQISNFTNMYISYKLNTTLSVDDLVTIGTQIGFAPDLEQSWRYETAPSTFGVGSSNNDNNPVFSNLEIYRGESCNNGFVRRQLQSVFDANKTGVTTLLLGASILGFGLFSILS